MTDTLPDVVLPSLAQDGNPPNWITYRGGDCRAYDRRLERNVWGPGHAFLRSSDLLFTNGVVRAWCGLDSPYLNVSIFDAGEWRETGVVSFDQTATTRLNGVRLVRVTPDVVTVALDVRSHGLVLVTLKRGERMLRIQHGTSLAPQVVAGHYVRLRGVPPYLALDGTLTPAAAKFGNGIPGDGSRRFPWPASLSVDAWTVARWWKPDDASATQLSSGLIGISDSTGGDVGRVWFETSDNTIRFTLGANTVTSAPLTWSAGETIGVAVAFSTSGGMSLTTKVADDSPVTVTNVNALDPGTSDDVWTAIDFGAVWDGVTTWGSGNWGDGTWGGGLAGNGLVDNAQIFEDRLTDLERTTLLDATSGLDGLPSPEGRLVWHAPFDARPLPAGSSFASGRRFEATAEDGTTRNADADGLTKAIAVLETGAVALPGLVLGHPGSLLDAAVFFATTGTQDDIADQHAQFAAANEQEIRVRA